VVLPFRVLWVVGIFLGTQMSLGLVWKMSDALNGMMAIPNLIALLLLSPVVFKLTRQYYQQSADNTVENKS
jgi:AGCS family alanine or glycine:cation symporter